jgi:lipopolysaccharide/colanic/teichoic acid biosynthesis glycosyltransferase
VLASAGFTLSLPIMLLVAVAVKLDSRGPVFYTQERVGKNGRTFKIIKFRSMRAGAERDSGPVWAEASDPRVTRVGRVIRKLRLDELPQFINVLRGDMNFVGPRPERPVFVEQLSAIIPYYSQRHLIKPGLTGWAQIKFPYGASVEDAIEKLRYDLYYIKNQSLLLDAAIVFETMKIVLFGRGGGGGGGGRPPPRARGGGFSWVLFMFYDRHNEANLKRRPCRPLRPVRARPRFGAVARHVFRREPPARGHADATTGRGRRDRPLGRGGHTGTDKLRLREFL